MIEDQRGIKRRKRVIEYAAKNGNIKTACLRFGIARLTFYLWRDRYRESGDEGLKSRRFGCHNFRATGITAYLENGGTLEKAQQIAAHEEPLDGETLRPHE